MQIEQAIECLRNAGYRVSKPRQRQSIAWDGRPTTKSWPPNKDRNERYTGVWPPAFKSHSVYRPRPLRAGGKPLPIDWAERTAALVFFMSRRARGCVELDQLQAAE